MTKNNEQMINGVDVSECMHFIAPNGCDVDSLLMSCQCDSNPNCYFKKWQHSMKFIELLEAKIGTKDFVLKDTIKEKVELQLQLNQLKEENEELKEINSTLLEYRKHSTTCQECYEDGLEDGKLNNKELRKLRKTLAEIKEIAWVNPVNTCWESLNLCDKCEEKEDCELQSPFAKLKLIIEKINEVEDGNI